MCYFLDISKAYDKIDHCLLYEKLLHKDVPVYIVKKLVCWYSHQEMYLRWSKSCSNKILCHEWSQTGWYIVSSSV